MFKVAAFSSTPAVPTFGAVISQAERLALLSERCGMAVQAISYAGLWQQAGVIGILRSLNIEPSGSGEVIDFLFRGVSHQIRFLDAGRNPKTVVDRAGTEIQQICSEQQIDCIFINLRDKLAVRPGLRALKIPTIHFITENEFSRPDDPDVSPELVRLIRSAPVICVNSRFVQNSFESAWGAQAHLLTNAIDVRRYREKPAASREFITMFQPYLEKGIAVFLALAAAMPQRRFLVTAGVGPGYRQVKEMIAAQPNVTLVQFNGDVREVLARSRIVLVPSIWQDSFPRVVVEALAAEVPVIGSDRGGIPEAGGAAVEIVAQGKLRAEERPSPELIESWKTAIEQLDHPAAYSARVKQAAVEVERYWNNLCLSIDRLGQMLLQK